MKIEPSIQELNTEQEIAISGPGLKPYLGNKATKIAKQIQGKEELDDPNKSENLEKFYGDENNKFLVFLRKKKGNKVWSIQKEDIYKFADHFKVTVNKIETFKFNEEKEIGISMPKLSLYFAPSKAGQLASKVQSKEEAGDPKIAESSEIKRKTLKKGSIQGRVFFKKEWAEYYLGNF